MPQEGHGERLRRTCRQVLAVPGWRVRRDSNAIREESAQSIAEGRPPPNSTATGQPDGARQAQQRIAKQHREAPPTLRIGLGRGSGQPKWTQEGEKEVHGDILVDFGT